MDGLGRCIQGQTEFPFQTLESSSSEKEWNFAIIMHG